MNVSQEIYSEQLPEDMNYQPEALIQVPEDRTEPTQRKYTDLELFREMRRR